MYLKFKRYSYSWLLINADMGDVRYSELGLILPYCSRIDIKGVSVSLLKSGGVYKVVDLKVKLSNRSVTLDGFGYHDREGIFLSETNTETHTHSMGLSSRNYIYNIYNGYFDRAYIKLKEV